MKNKTIVFMLISSLLLGLSSCKKKAPTSCEKISDFGSSSQSMLVGGWELDFVEKGSKREKPDYIYYLSIRESNLPPNQIVWSFMTYWKSDNNSNTKYRTGHFLPYPSIDFDGHKLNFGQPGITTSIYIWHAGLDKEDRYFDRVQHGTCFSVTKRRLYLLCESEKYGTECFVYKRDTKNKYEN